jgi:hypothetical protein
MPQQLTTEAVTISVTPILPADADVTTPKDIAPPVPLAPPGVPLWIWGAAGGGLALLTGVWWRYRQRRTTSVTRLQPAHVLALEALQRLRPEDCMVQQRHNEFYIQLSDILRHYVWWRFGLHAPEQTTDELLAAVHAARDGLAVHHELLSIFLHHCDLVKFARHQPTPDHVQQDLACATAFVTQTADARVVVAVPMQEGPGAGSKRFTYRL